MESCNYTLSDLEDDNNLIDVLSNKVNSQYLKLNELKNKLWKCFLSNDGSMTKMLNELFDNKIKLNLNYHYIFDKLTKNNEIQNEVSYLNLFESITESNLDCSKYIIRKMNFKVDDRVVMIGISIWDSGAYESIYKTEVHNKAIGIILKENEVEYFKTINNLLLKNDNQIFIFRFSIYKINKKIAFILLEVFESETFKNLFGSFE
jgi:chorismate-pyruvate lyase